jgi:hypothetical protein
LDLSEYSQRHYGLRTDGGFDWGDSFLKLDPSTLLVANDNTGSFTPADQYFRSAQHPTCPDSDGDIDYGSGGVMLIPDGEVPGYPDLAVSGDKEEALWFIDRTTPGGHVATCDNSCTCNGTFLDTNIVERYGTLNGPIHNNPAFWENGSSGQPPTNYIYVAGFPGARCSSTRSVKTQ